MVIDIDVRKRMRQAQLFIAFMLGTTLAGIVWDDLALYSLVANCFVWTVWYVNKVSAIRQIALVDDKSLHEPRGVIKK